LRALVAGWFSIHDGGATAGDLLVRDVLCEWLDEQGVMYDVAQERKLGPGVDWFRVSPERYSHLIFACGPIGSNLAVRELIDRFAKCRRVAINVSITAETEWKPFDLLLARDGDGYPRADIALSAPIVRPPVIAVVKMEEHPGARVDLAHKAFARLLASRDAAAFAVDTVLEPGTPGRRTAGEVLALIARADVVLTTRLHGLVLALRQGVPGLALDPVPGGAKVLAQAQALAWPAAAAINAIDDSELERLLAWCLTSDAREKAIACAKTASAAIDEIRAMLMARL
jgi:Polysaccharide pyruvyl transferase